MRFIVTSSFNEFVIGRVWFREIVLRDRSRNEQKIYLCLKGFDSNAQALNATAVGVLKVKDRYTWRRHLIGQDTRFSFSVREFKPRWRHHQQ